MQRASWLALPPEPWKNGGGVTRTLAADATGRWRVSIADIDRDGPYSRFSGYDRVSVVLSGQGVALRGEGVAVSLRPRVPALFAGDEVLQSRLAGGPVRVLNLFVQRGLARARVACLGAEGDARVAGSLADAAGECIATRLVVAVEACRFRGAPPGIEWALAAGEFVLAPGDGDALHGPEGLSRSGAFLAASKQGFAVSLDVAVHAPGLR